jgi:hypothetical protein
LPMFWNYISEWYDELRRMTELLLLPVLRRALLRRK